MAVGRGAVALALLGTAAGWLAGEHRGVHGRKGRGFRQAYAKVAADAVRSAREQEMKARALQTELVDLQGSLRRGFDALRETRDDLREREVEVERRERRLDQQPVNPEWWQEWRRMQAMGLALVSPEDMVRRFPPGGIAGLVREREAPLLRAMDERRERLGAGIADALRFAMDGASEVTWGEPVLPTERLRQEAHEMTREQVGTLRDDEGTDLADLPVGVDPYADLQRQARTSWAPEAGGTEAPEPVTEDDVATAAAELDMVDAEDERRAQDTLVQAYGESDRG